jgi:Uma2 family endonuclease
MATGAGTTSRPSSGRFATMSNQAEQLSFPPRLPSEDELPCDDGMPMETARHRMQMELLLRGLELWSEARGDVVANGNQFLYFNTEHLRAQDFRGPDVYVATGVRPGERKSWVVWQEGKAPDVVIELLSESTAAADKGEKMRIYRDQLRVPNYYWFDPFAPEDRAGFILQGNSYLPLLPDGAGRLPVPSLGLKLGLWQGRYLGLTTEWLRWTDEDGNWLALREESEQARADSERQRAEAERQRAETERQRADAAEAELARLRAQLEQDR